MCHLNRGIKLVRSPCCEVVAQLQDLFFWSLFSGDDSLEKWPKDHRFDPPKKNDVQWKHYLWARRTIQPQNSTSLFCCLLLIIFKSIAHVPKPFQVTQWKKERKKEYPKILSKLKVKNTKNTKSKAGQIPGSISEHDTHSHTLAHHRLFGP